MTIKKIVLILLFSLLIGVCGVIAVKAYHLVEDINAAIKEAEKEEKPIPSPGGDSSDEGGSDEGSGGSTDDTGNGEPTSVYNYRLLEDGEYTPGNYYLTGIYYFKNDAYYYEVSYPGEAGRYYVCKNQKLDWDWASDGWITAYDSPMYYKQMTVSVISTTESFVLPLFDATFYFHMYKTDEIFSGNLNLSYKLDRGDKFYFGVTDYSDDYVCFYEASEDLSLKYSEYYVENVPLYFASQKISNIENNDTSEPDVSEPDVSEPVETFGFQKSTVTPTKNYIIDPLDYLEQDGYYYYYVVINGKYYYAKSSNLLSHDGRWVLDTDSCIYEKTGNKISTDTYVSTFIDICVLEDNAWSLSNLFYYNGAKVKLIYAGTSKELVYVDYINSGPVGYRPDCVILQTEDMVVFENYDKALGYYYFAVVSKDDLAFDSSSYSEISGIEVKKGSKVYSISLTAEENMQGYSDVKVIH